MLELLNNQLVFSFPEVHPDARMAVEFQRTLRIPDDEGTYPLPPGLGAFPTAHVEDHKDKVPGVWAKHGGVMIPMFQSEALWIRFLPHTAPGRKPYPFAVKVAAGKKSAITGKDWRKGLHKKDYCVLPFQKWLDGFVVDGGLIRQFIAVPLGAGLSVEEQLGDDEIGGLQLEVFPMKGEDYNRRFPKPPPRGIDTWEGRPGMPGRRYSMSSGTKGGQSMRSRRRRSRGPTDGVQTYGSSEVKTKGFDVRLESASSVPIGAAAAEENTRGVELNCDCDDGETNVNYSCDSIQTMDFSPDMAMGAGGTMQQSVEADPYGKSEFVKKVPGISRSFVHLANSMMWRAITGSEPPNVPLTAADYKTYGFPWYDYYSDQTGKLGASKKLSGVNTVAEMAAKKGMKGVLPENESFEVPGNEVVQLGPDEVSNGTW